MNDSKRYVRLGLFVMTSVGVLVAALFVLGWRSWFQSTFTFETYFDKSIAGLALGSPASFRGVPLGQVTEILTSVATYEPDVPVEHRRDYIVVRVKATMPAAEAEQMRRDMAVMIRQGLRAQTQLAGVTGQQYLEIDFLDAKSHPPLPFGWTPKYTYLPSAPSVAGEIIAKAQAFLAGLDEADIKTLGQNLNTLVVDLDAKIRVLPVSDLAAAAQAALKKVDAVATRLDAVLADPSLGTTLDNAAVISARLRRLADDGDYDRMIHGVDEAAARLSGVIGDNRSDVREVIRELRGTANNLRAVSEAIRRDPSGVLLGGPPRKVQLPTSVP